MASSNQRERDLARAKEERRRARAVAESQRQARRKRTAILAGLAAVVVAVLAYVLVIVVLPGDGDQTAGGPDTGGGGESQAAGPQPVQGCTQPGETAADALQFDAPEPVLGTATQVGLTLTTNCGDVVIAADPAAAPQTVNAMAFLAQEGYFDSTLCHRLVTSGIFVLQCGDPTASGSGSPGFQLPDENLPAEGANNYPAGSVAMANAGPGTSGSQFFIVYQDTTLPPSYTLWGTVTQGLDVVERIAAAGTVDGGPDGAPAQATMIERAEASLS
jgi:peptidyl-prolyl cis-trans isomerase B (cyclophilin B)